MEGSEKRVRDAVEAFINRMGWELLSSDHEGFVVFNDGDLVFAAIVYSTDPTGDFPEYQTDRKAFERAITSWLIEHPETNDTRIRLDSFEMKIVLANKAIIRHGIGITCDSEVEHAES